MDNQSSDLFNHQLAKLYEDEPVELTRLLAISAGKACAETNAATMDLKTECTFKEIRYAVKVKISVNKIK